MSCGIFRTSHGAAMALSLAHHWHDFRRQGRLLWRYLRHESTAAGRRTRPAALATLYRGTNQWLRASGVEHCLVYGTLLGQQREGRILAHDRDVDFGAPVEAYPKLLDARPLLPCGFALHDTSWRHGGPKIYLTYRGWEADIYFFAAEGGMLRTILRSDLPGDFLPFPREHLFPLQPVEFLGEPTFIPADPAAYLTHLYGYTGPDAELDPVTRYYRPRRRPTP